MKHSLRRLFKSPAVALTAILAVGVAIGANALIFSVVNGIILKPLPYPEPAALVGVWHVAPGFLTEVQQAVWSVHPNLPLARVRRLAQMADESMAQASFVLVILDIRMALGARGA